MTALPVMVAVIAIAIRAIANATLVDKYSQRAQKCARFFILQDLIFVGGLFYAIIFMNNRKGV